MCFLFLFHRSIKKFLTIMTPIFIFYVHLNILTFLFVSLKTIIVKMKNNELGNNLTFTEEFFFIFLVFCFYYFSFSYKGFKYRYIASRVE